MKLTIDDLKRKLHTLDKWALLRLRKMLEDPYNIKWIKEARDKVSSGISKGGEEVRKKIRERDIPEDLKDNLESYDIFFELKCLDIVESVAEGNIKEIIGEIDKMLLEMSKK